MRGELLRVQLLSEAGRDAEALAAIRKAGQANPDSSELVEVEVRLLARQKQMKQALETAQKAAKRWPNNAEMFFLLGSLQDETGDKKAAFKNDGTAHRPATAIIRPSTMWATPLPKKPRSRPRHKPACARQRNCAQPVVYHRLVGLGLLQPEKLDDALKEIRRAVTLDEHTDASIWEHYGDIAARAGLKDEARTAYQKAMELKPDNAEALRQRLSNL